MPGEPMLAVQRGLHARGGPGPLDVPVVQEGNELEEQPGMLARYDRGKRSEAPTVASENGQPVISAPAPRRGANAAMDRNQSVREAHESTTIVRKSPATQVVAQGQVSRSQEVSSARSPKSDAPQPTLSHSEPGQKVKLPAREDADSSSRQMTADRKALSTSAGTPPVAAVVKEVRAERARIAHAHEAQSESERVRNIVREEKVAASHARPLEDGFRQRPQEMRGDPVGEGSAISGTRVRIGTVEVRTTVAQPAPVQAAAVAPQLMVERGAPGRARAGGGEPLARGLAWSYGLVQG
jgi:hypothetical protein